MKTKDLTVCAMLAAMCAVLGYISIDMGNIKISFEDLPVLLGGALFGPVHGLLVGTVGTLIYQLIRYGISATTLLWILPYSVCGFLMGWISKKNNFALSGRKLFAATIGCELLVTVLNTFVIYIDSKLYGWYYPALIMGSLALRLVICVGKAIVFAEVLSLIIKKINTYI